MPHPGRIACALAFGLSFFLPVQGRGADESGKPYGIDKRTPWTKSRVVGSPEPPSPYRTVRAFPKLKIQQPLAIAPIPGTDELILISHEGSWALPATISRLKNSPDVESLTKLLAFKDRICYGVTFHPKFRENGYLYIGCNGQFDKDTQTRVSRFTMDLKTLAIDPKSEQLIIQWPSNGHNGGDMVFGLDGRLYVSSGDGTSDSDTNLTGQTTNDLLAAVLRIDVDHPDPGKAYSVPKDNPWVGKPDYRPELWAYGFRNPWRITCDRVTGHIWVGQNGQDMWEQVINVRKGGNYGWSVTEGGHPFYVTRKAGPDPILKPTADHSHSEARSISGGIVYWGKKLPKLRGAYIYGDWSTGRVWGIKNDGTKTTYHEELVDTPFAITGFGVDHEGELFVIDHGNGAFHRLEPNNEPDRHLEFPRKLSETGVFAKVAGHKVDPALIPYSVNAPLWSDGAGKARFIALPGDQTISYNDGGAWGFSEGAVLVKSFKLDTVDRPEGESRWIETRLMTRSQGEWVGYSYLWNHDQTEAYLVPKEGTDRVYQVRDAASSVGSKLQTWHYPSRSECMVCHSRAAAWVLGLQTGQLNKAHEYPNGVVDNQLRTLEHIGVLQTGGSAEKPVRTLPKRPEALAKLANPHDPWSPLEARVKSYLHSNCASCHIPAGGGNAQMNLGFSVPLKDMGIFDAAPNHDKFGLADPKIIAPGHPDRSVMLKRISRRGIGQMPPLASAEVDPDAIKILTDWILSADPRPAAKPGW